MVLPGVTRDLARDLENHEPVRPGGETAEPAKLVKLAQDADQRVVGGLLSDVLELGAGDRSELTTAAAELVERDS